MTPHTPADDDRVLSDSTWLLRSPEWEREDLYLHSDGVFDERVGLEELRPDDGVPPDPARFLFRAVPQLSYAAAQQLAEAASQGDADRAELLRAQRDQEARRNAQLLATPARLHFGQTVQLQHVATGKFVAVLQRTAAELDRDCRRVALTAQGSEMCWFTLRPRFKTRALRAALHFGDHVLLESAHAHLEGQRLHVSPRRFPREADGSERMEVNLAPAAGDAGASGWAVQRYVRAPVPAGLLRAGLAVRFFHAESDRFLAASAVGSKPPYFLDGRGQPPAKALFRVEFEDPTAGGPVSWRAPVHLRHAGSGRYLAVRRHELRGADVTSLAAELVPSAAGEPRARFYLHPAVSLDGGEAAVRLGDDSFCVEHRMSEPWFPGGVAVASVWLSVIGSLPKGPAGRNAHLGFAAERRDEDTFRATAADAADADALAHVASFARAARDYAARLEAGFDIRADDPLAAALERLRAYFEAADAPVDQRAVLRPLRQRFARELKLVDTLFALLRKPLDLGWGMPRVARELRPLHRALYDAAAVVVGGDHASELYVTRRRYAEPHAHTYYEEVIAQLGHGTGAANCLRALLTNSEAVLTTCIDTPTVMRFVDLLLDRGPVERFLRFLAAICDCEGRAVRANQIKLLQVVYSGHSAGSRHLPQPDEADRFRTDAFKANRLRLLVETAADPTSPLAPWPVPGDAPACGAQGFVGSAAHLAGTHDIVVSWQGAADWAHGREQLFFSPAALGLATREFAPPGQLDEYEAAALERQRSQAARDRERQQRARRASRRRSGVPADSPVAARAAGAAGGGDHNPRQWVALEDVVWVLDPERFKGDRSLDADHARYARLLQLAEYYVAQLELFAQMCLDECTPCVELLRRQFSFDLLAAGMASARLPHCVRAAFACLAQRLYLDCFPHAPLRYPRTVWQPDDPTADAGAAHFRPLELPPPEAEDVLFRCRSLGIHGPVREPRPYFLHPGGEDKFFLLEQIVDRHMRELAAHTLVDESGHLHEFTAQVVDVLQALIRRGFHADLDKVSRFTGAIVRALDGRDEVLLVGAGDRFEDTPATRATIQSKVRMCGVVALLHRLQLDATTAGFLARFRRAVGRGKRLYAEPEAGRASGEGEDEDEDEHTPFDVDEAVAVPTTPIVGRRASTLPLPEVSSDLDDEEAPEPGGRHRRRRPRFAATPIDPAEACLTPAGMQLLAEAVRGPAEPEQDAETNPLVHICLDLMLYQNNDLFEAALATLFRVFSTSTRLMDTLARALLLERTAPETVRETEQLVRILRHNTHRVREWVDGAGDVRLERDVFTQIEAALLHLRAGIVTDDAADNEMRLLLLEHGLCDLAMELVEACAAHPQGQLRSGDDKLWLAKDVVGARGRPLADHVALVQHLALLAVAAVAGARASAQEAIFARLPTLVRCLDAHPASAARAIDAALRNNAALCARADEALLGAVAAVLQPASSANAPVLALLRHVMTPNGEPLPRAQNLVARMFASEAHPQLTVRRGHLRLGSGLDQCDSPEHDLGFALELVELLEHACQGCNASAQLVCQRVLPLEFVLAHLLDARTLFPVRRALTRFARAAFVDTEITDYARLADDLRVWDLLEQMRATLALFCDERGDDSPLWAAISACIFEGTLPFIGAFFARRYSRAAATPAMHEAAALVAAEVARVAATGRGVPSVARAVLAAIEGGRSRSLSLAQVEQSMDEAADRAADSLRRHSLTPLRCRANLQLRRYLRCVGNTAETVALADGEFDGLVTVLLGSDAFETLCQRVVRYIRARAGRAESRDVVATAVALLRLCLARQARHGRLAEAQAAMCALGAAAAVVDTLAALGGSERLRVETLRLGILLLEGGNRLVQDAVLEYVSATQNTAFFAALHAQVRGADRKHVHSTFRFLQLLVEGHHSALQRMLQDQQPFRLPASVDIVTAAVRELAKLTRSDEALRGLSAAGARVLEALLDFVVEVVQGPCSSNQELLASSPLVDACQQILVAVDADYSELRQLALRAVISLLEGRGSGDAGGDPVRAVVAKALNVSILRRQLRDFSESDFGGDILTLTRTLGGEVAAAMRPAPPRAAPKADLFATAAEFADAKRRHRDEQQYARAHERVAGQLLSVEILWNDRLERVFFPAPAACRFLSDALKGRVLAAIDFSAENAFRDFLKQADPLDDETRHLLFLSRFALYRLLARLVGAARRLSLLVAAVLNVVLVLSLRRGGDNKVRFSDGWAEDAVFVLGIAAVSLSGLVYAFDVLHVLPITARRYRRERAAAAQRGARQWRAPKQLARLAIAVAVRALALAAAGAAFWYRFDFVPAWMPWAGGALVAGDALGALRAAVAAPTSRLAAGACALYEVATSGPLAYRLAHAAAAVLGAVVAPIFFAVQLLDVVTMSDSLARVVRAVTLPRAQLGMTGVLMAIVVYLFALVYFYLFSADLWNPRSGVNDCDDLYQCFLVVLHNGLIVGGGIGEYIAVLHGHTPDTHDAEYFGGRVAVDLAFFVIVLVLMLNIIFGIIIDTFGQLRDDAALRRRLMRSQCFICHVAKDDFEAGGGSARSAALTSPLDGFSVHVKHEHNMWDYLFLIIHLRCKDVTEFTGSESYVHECLASDNLSWVPVGRALALQQGVDSATAQERRQQQTLEALVAGVRGVDARVSALAGVVDGVRHSVEAIKGRVTGVERRVKSAVFAGSGAGGGGGAARGGGLARSRSPSPVRFADEPTRLVPGPPPAHPPPPGAQRRMTRAGSMDPAAIAAGKPRIMRAASDSAGAPGGAAGKKEDTLDPKFGLAATLPAAGTGAATAAVSGAKADSKTSFLERVNRTRGSS